MLESCAVDGLLDCVGCDHSEYRRHAGLDADRTHAVSYLSRDVIVMIRLAADHTADAKHRGILAAFGELPRDHWNFKSTGHEDLRDLRIFGAVPKQTICRGVGETFGNEAVKFRDDQRETLIRLDD